MKYAFCLLVLILITCGAYCFGYRVGSSDKQVEYVTKKVVEYVEVDKAKSEIYSAPNINRDSVLRMYKDNKF